MRTYYSGRDAIVTETSLTIRPPKGPTYALRDLDPGQLAIIETDTWFITFYPVGGVAFTLLYMSPVAAYEGSWPVAVGSVLVAAVLGVAGWAWWSRHRTYYTLEGVYRGTRTSLLTTSSEARAFQIRYAIREATEELTEQPGSG